MPGRERAAAKSADQAFGDDFGPEPELAPPPPRDEPPAKRKSGRLALRNWRVRNKLIVVLLVPSITAIVLGYLRIDSELKQASEFGRASTTVVLSQKTADLVHEIQGERDQQVGWIAAGKPADRSAVDKQIEVVEAKRKVLQEQEGSLGKLDEAVQQLYTRVVDDLPTLEAVRASAKSTLYPAGDTIKVYQSIIDTLLQLEREVTKVSSDRGLSSRSNTIDAIARTKEYAALQNSILRGAAAANSFGPGQITQLRSAQAQFTAALADFTASATPEQRGRYDNTVAGPEIDERLRLLQTALNRGDADVPINIDIPNLDTATSGTIAKLKTVENNELEELKRISNARVDDARNNAIRDAALIGAALLLALIFMLIVTRSLLRPLRTLRKNALDVADRRLPEEVHQILNAPDPVLASSGAIEPVPVFTTEEVGQVARSFDAVHEQAVRLAAEQAILRDNINSIFVNLSRRSQALVERQLNLIDRLEQDEQDPDQLASLFELDHLATRMRRNSESLLVLSGTGLSRQLARPVPAAEVVGAAVSEVEQYARIEVASAPEVAVMGRAVNDLVHLIAELLDNATTFSEPEKKVIVRIAATRKKELAIQITDQGVGMLENEINNANLRLADPPDMDVAVTRRMGLYVVARLAKRHNISVRLRDNEDIEGGLIARITVPTDLIQPMRGGGPLTSVISTQAALSIPEPTRPVTRSGGGIANAFTGNMPRVRNDSGQSSDTHAPTPPPVPAPDQSGPIPTFMPLDQSTGGNGAMPLPKRSSKAEAETREVPQPFDLSQKPNFEQQAPLYERSADYGAALFGDPLPEQEAPDFESTFSGSVPTTGSPEDTGSLPYVPVTPRSSGTNGTNGSAREVVDDPTVDAPTERLPIYEAVLSQWFEAGDSESVASPPAPADRQQAPQAAAAEQDEIDPFAEQRASAWQSPGDEGWQAAQALLDTSGEPEPVTSAGLPKRVPKAQLVPGSAAPRPSETGQKQEDQVAAPPLPPRSADAIRGRMSSFQQGIRRGRHALIDAYPGENTGSSTSRQDEEQE